MDFVCVAAILLSIAGAAVFLSRVFTIELCNVDGNDVNTPCNNRRKKRALGYYDEQLVLMLKGKNRLSQDIFTCASRVNPGQPGMNARTRQLDFPPPGRDRPNLESIPLSARHVKPLISFV